MAWRTPQTSWTDIKSFETTDMERVEQNIEYLAGNGSEQQLGTDDDVQHANVTVDSLTSSGAISGTTGTFSGAVSGTTGTFSGNVSGTNGLFSGAIQGASINTGHGAYEIGQDLRPTDEVTFSAANINGGVGSAHYSGSAPAQTSLPIGSIVLVLTYVSTYAMNSVIPVYYNGAGTAGYTNTSSGGAALLSGTWRARGWMFESNISFYYYMAQRTA